jgi:anti-sigma factor RsiW
MTTPHDIEWNDRLQDWLDGDLDAADAAALQAHMAGCAACRARADELQALDRSLRSAAPRLALDDAFDAELFAQIEAVDESKGVALAFALTWWMNDAGVMRALIAQSAAEFGPGNSGQVQLIATTLLGAALGGLIARWLATVVE